MGTGAKSAVFFAALLFLFSGCSTLIFVRKPEVRTLSEPSYSKDQVYFFWGLVAPDEEVFGDKICLQKKVDQVSVGYTGKNLLWNLVTFGLYSPRTVKVWCSL